MLYLEDYLEMIEHLPQELRDRFTDMREMDLSIHNNMDELEKRVKVFFNDCKHYQNQDIPQELDSEFQLIRKEYYKTLEDADEKVHLANQMYDLVDKYLRRLDSELHKFKCELEADNKGITEVLEKRSLELDTPTAASNLHSQQKENRYESLSTNNFRYTRPRSEKRRDSGASLNSSFSEKRQAVAAATVPPSSSAFIDTTTSAATSSARPVTCQNVTTVTSTNITYTLGHHGLGAGPAIAAAASQAIAATQQMQQGRRTASLKASYEAINNTGGHGHEFNIGRELAGAAQTAIQAIQQDHANNKKKQKKWSSSSNNTASSSATANLGTSSVSVAASSSSGIATSHSNSVQSSVAVPSSIDTAAMDVDAANADATDGEWTYDPNEPRYCLCNQVSYGDMVACDNEDCPSEWFHYPCVGITAPPKGKWYCPQCTTSMKRRGGRKN